MNPCTNLRFVPALRDKYPQSRHFKITKKDIYQYANRRSPGAGGNGNITYAECCKGKRYVVKKGLIVLHHAIIPEVWQNSSCDAHWRIRNNIVASARKLIYLRSNYGMLSMLPKY